MATLKLEIPDGLFCKGCSFLSQPDPRDGGRTECKIFQCALGNKLTDIFKAPMCIEQSRGSQIAYRGDADA